MSRDAMTPQDRALADMASGAALYYRGADYDGGLTQLQWVARGDLWQLSVRGDALSWITRVPLHRYPLATMVPGDAAERVCPPSEVPAALWDRARVVPDRADAVLTALRAGGVWLRAGGSQWWTHAARVGDVVVESGPPVRVSVIEHLESPLLEAVWNDPALASTVPPADVRAACETLLDAVANDDARVMAGEAALIDTHSDGTATLVFALGAHIVWLTIGASAVLPERVRINPYQAVIGRYALRKVLCERRCGRTAYERRWQLDEVPAVVDAIAPELSRGLARTKREIIDAYVARMHTGMTLSGGPTSDQSWTVSWDGEQFWIAGYRPTEDGGLEPTREPISEARVREMLATYTAFGLSELPG